MMAGPYEVPWAPRTLYDYGAGSGDITRLILEQGRARAEGAQRSGDIWGRAVENIGALGGQAIQAVSEERKTKRNEAALARQDAAFVSLLDRSSGAPDPREVLRIYGPDRGMKIAGGLSALGDLKTKRGEAALAAVPPLVDGLDALSEPMRAAGWPAARAAVLGTGLLPETALPEQYTSEAWAQVKAWRQGAVPQQGKTREIKVRLPGGGERISLVADKPGLTFESAPEPTKPPNLQHIETAQGIRPFNPATGEVGPVIAQAKPPVGAHEWVVRDGKPVRVSEDQIRPGDQPYAPPKQSLKNVTSGDAGRVADLDTSLDDLKTLETNLGQTGPGSWLGAQLPNWISATTGVGAESKTRQAVIDRVKQVIGKTLEGGVLRKEDETKYERILPTIGDPPEVAKTKIAGLQAAIAQRRQRLLDALSDSGFDTTRFETRAEAKPPVSRFKIEIEK